MTLSRRTVLQSGAGALTLGALAGCLSKPGGGGNTEGGYAAFFTLADWAKHVAGDEMEIKNPINVGEQGHGWEPSLNLQRKIASSEVFIYLDTPQFSWAQTIAADLESEYDHVTVIDALADIEGQLLPADHGEGTHKSADTDVRESSTAHAPENFDPHVWVDPVLSQDMVKTIASGLGEADPDNANQYTENAAAYTDRIAKVNHQFEALMENATREVAVLASHDSFRYLEARYGFELRTPVGVSPNAVESSDQISDLIAVIRKHNIDTILYDPFETSNPDSDVPQMVDVLLKETGATEYEPITAIEGTTKAWNERGYGWIEQMEQINIPSLSKAFGAA